jgi:hypothetical protein
LLLNLQSDLESTGHSQRMINREQLLRFAAEDNPGPLGGPPE